MQVPIRARNFLKTAVILTAAALAAGCASLPVKHIYTEVVIEAPPRTVWDILVDNSRYAEWNPYHVRVDGRLAPGEKLDVEIHKPNGETVEIEPRVMRIEPLRELTWGGGIHGIFFGEHVFLLEPLRADATRLVHKEDFVGIAVPFASLDAIEAGYRQMNRALKKRAEAGLVPPPATE